MDPCRIHAGANVETGEIDLDLQPSYDKFAEAIKSINGFHQSWEHKQEFQGQSCSSYDQSLANLAAMAGWTDREMTALMVEHRRKYDASLERPEYYARTIAKAREGAKKDTARNALKAVSVAGLDIDEARVVLNNALSDLIGEKVIRFIRYAGSYSKYCLETENNQYEIGSADCIITSKRFFERIFDCIGVALPPIAQKDWYETATLIAQTAELEEAPENSPHKQAEMWARQYLAGAPTEENIGRAFAYGNPFKKDGQLYIHGPAFRAFVQQTLGERMTARDMGNALRQAGFRSKTISAAPNGTGTSRMFWEVPRRLLGG